MFTSSHVDYLINSSNSPYFYVIKSTQVKGNWYFLDFEGEDDKHLRVMWIPRMYKAYMFTSEQSVEEFRSEFLSSRPTEIIRINTKKLMWRKR